MKAFTLLLPVMMSVTTLAHASTKNDLSAMNGIWRVTSARTHSVQAGDLLKLESDGKDTFWVTNIKDPGSVPFLVSDCAAINGAPLTNGTEANGIEVLKSSTNKGILSCKQLLPDDANEVIKAGSDEGIHLKTTYQLKGAKIKVKDYVYYVNRKNPSVGTATLERVGDLTAK